jgi:endonuclease YncB( thermonuclease family)
MGVMCGRRLELTRLSLVVLVLSGLVIPLGWSEEMCGIRDGQAFTTCDGREVRIWGIQVPRAYNPLEKETMMFIEKLTAGKQLALSCNGRRLHREMCMVSVPQEDGTTVDLGRELVGWGFAYDEPTMSGGMYAQSEQFAKSEKRGLWATSPDKRIRPWSWLRKF